ncbi:MAG: ribonuclease HI [Bacilli bacterium]|nr:ribonuclease HI [Bacilli bacterium]
MEINDDALIIYTDGSSFSNPRKGGNGFKIKFPEKCNQKDRSFCPPGYNGATNNRMEIEACVLAVQKARRFLEEKRCFDNIIIYTDSQYVVDNYKNAMFVWSSNGWRKREGAPVRNKSTWKDLVREIRNIRMIVDIRKVKGHSDDPDNKEADKLAKRSAKRKSFNTAPGIIRRKKSPNSVQLGCVRMKNQELLIRIINSLGPVDKEHEYKYEVMDENSEYFQYIDQAWTKITLRPNHTYLARFNDIQGYPQILEIIEEIITNS